MKGRKAPQMSQTSDSFPPADVLSLDGDEVFALGTISGINFAVMFHSSHVMMSQLRIPSAFRSHVAD